MPRRSHPPQNTEAASRRKPLQQLRRHSHTLNRLAALAKLVPSFRWVPKFAARAQPDLLHRVGSLTFQQLTFTTINKTLIMSTYPHRNRPSSSYMTRHSRPIHSHASPHGYPVPSSWGHSSSYADTWHYAHPSTMHSSVGTYPTGTTSTSTRPRGYPKPLGVGRGFPVLARGKFLESQPCTLVLHPSRSESTWLVRNRRGARLFSLSRARAFLARERSLIDTRSGHAVLRARAPSLSARSTVEVYADGADRKSLLTLQKKSLFESRTVHGFIHGKSSKKPELVIRSDSKGRKFTFTDRRSIEIATVKRYSARSRSGEKRFEYRMHVSPGYDTALLAMCMVCVHEMLTG